MEKAANTPSRRTSGKIDWRLTRFLLRHLFIGAASGWIFVAALVHFDIGGIGTLVRESAFGPLPVIMLLAVITITWGSCAMGTAVFLMPRKDDADGPKKRAPILAPAAMAQPQLVHAKPARRG